MTRQTLALWVCDDGTYDIVGEEGVIVQNVPAKALLNIHALLEAVDLLETLRYSMSQYDDGEWFLHEGGEDVVGKVDEFLEKLK